ncbi:DTX3 [Branchiostoma lanceolatum]|uniref:RING-type E3 ubiquitin transferase n=1 Tax=Branchiostoma lanceolatum TaxID=7740 RepID=A0A8J9ZNP4_BRALA|nr:DTX3 [Branchiostoma lanceolatum]
MAAERTVLVSSIPADLTGDKIEIHFGKKSTGGGDVEKVDFQAKVTFCSAEVATRVVNRSHRLGKQSVPVRVEPLEGTESASLEGQKGGRLTKKVFASVSAVVTPAEVPDLAECPEEIMTALSAQTGVTWAHEPGGYRLQGTWGQVENARLQGTWGQVATGHRAPGDRGLQAAGHMGTGIYRPQAPGDRGLQAAGHMGTGHLGTGGYRLQGTWGQVATGHRHLGTGGYRLQGTWGQVENARCLLQRRYCRDTMDEAVESGSNDAGEEGNNTDQVRASAGDVASTEVKMAWGEVEEQQNSTTASNTKRDLTRHLVDQTARTDRDHAVGIRSEDPTSTATKQKGLPVDATSEISVEDVESEIVATGTQQSTGAKIVIEDPLTSDESSDSDQGDERERSLPSHLTAAKGESLPDTNVEASVVVEENEAIKESESEQPTAIPKDGVPTAKEHQLNRGESSEESMRPITKSSAKYVTVDPDIMAYIVHVHKDKLATIQDKFKVTVKMENSTDCICIQPREQCSHHDLEEAYETFVSLYQDMFKDVRPHRANLAEVQIPIGSIRVVLDMIKREHDNIFLKLNDEEKMVVFCGEEDKVRKARAKFYEVLSIPDPAIAHRRGRRRAPTTDASTPAAIDATTNKDADKGPQAHQKAAADSKPSSVGSDTMNIASSERSNVSKRDMIAQSHTSFEADSTGSGDVPEVKGGMGTRNGDVRPKDVRSKLPTQANNPIGYIRQPIKGAACGGDLSTDGVKAGRTGGADGDVEGPPGKMKTCHVSRDRLDFVTRTGVKVLIYQGDISQEVADVIVSCNNESLDSRSGIARAISEAGGPEIRRACVDYIRRRGRLSAGQKYFFTVRLVFTVEGHAGYHGWAATGSIVGVVGLGRDRVGMVGQEDSAHGVLRTWPSAGGIRTAASCSGLSDGERGRLGTWQTWSAGRLAWLEGGMETRRASWVGVSIWTPGGRLRCQYVVHTMSPQPSGDQTDHQQLFSTFLDLLNIAEFDLKVNSIAIPAIGSGIAGFSKAVCADVMFRVISAFEDYQTPDSLLKEIRLVNIDAKTTTEFVRVFSQHLAGSGVSTASAGHESGSPGVSGARDKDDHLYVFTQGGKGQGERGGKMGTATQRGAQRGRGYGRSKPYHSRVGNVACNFNTAESAGSDGGRAQRLEAAAAFDDDSDEVDEDEKCPVCLGRVSDPRTLDCKHTFCSPCIDMCIKSKPECPVCKMPVGNSTRRGNQPDGSMTHRVDQGVRLPGYERYGTIVIDYHIPGGTQGKEHPNPGLRFSGDMRTAYLPDSPEGREVLRLLRRAFDSRLVFTIGTSGTTGQPNTVVWNDIQHKTNMQGGPTNYGYPDPTYLQRVRVDLASKGIK